MGISQIMAGDIAFDVADSGGTDIPEQFTPAEGASCASAFQEAHDAGDPDVAHRRIQANIQIQNALGGNDACASLGAVAAIQGGAGGGANGRGRKGRYSDTQQMMLSQVNARIEKLEKRLENLDRIEDKILRGEQLGNSKEEQELKKRYKEQTGKDYNPDDDGAIQTMHMLQQQYKSETERELAHAKDLARRVEAGDPKAYDDARKLFNEPSNEFVGSGKRVALAAGIHISEEAKQISYYTNVGGYDEDLVQVTLGIAPSEDIKTIDLDANKEDHVSEVGFKDLGKLEEPTPENFGFADLGTELSSVDLEGPGLSDTEQKTVTTQAPDSVETDFGFDQLSKPNEDDIVRDGGLNAPDMTAEFTLASKKEALHEPELLVAEARNEKIIYQSTLTV